MRILKDRLEAALAFRQKLTPEVRVTKGSLAKACRVAASSVHAWFSGDTRELMGPNLLAAAAYLRVNADWLGNGVGPMKLSDVDHANTRETRSPVGSVPKISWVRAGVWCDAQDPFEPGDAEEWVPCPDRHSANTFALEVIGDSMDAPPDGYREGEIIFVDPNVAAEPGMDVIVRNPDGKATFKRLKREPEGLYLLALNPSFPDRMIRIPEGSEICGVVIGSYTRRRR